VHQIHLRAYDLVTPSTAGRGLARVCPDGGQPPAQRSGPGAGERPRYRDQRLSAEPGEYSAAVPSRRPRTLTRTAIAAGRVALQPSITDCERKQIRRRASRRFRIQLSLTERTLARAPNVMSCAGLRGGRRK